MDAKDRRGFLGELRAGKWLWSSSNGEGVQAPMGLTLVMGADDPELSGIIIGEAMRLHSSLGPGLFESTYEQCLASMLVAKGFRVQTQVLIPLEFESLFVPNAFRLDMIVDDAIIVEVKATEVLTSAHFAQVLTYLKLTKLPLGLLINFNEAHLRTGIKRIINTPKKSSA